MTAAGPPAPSAAPAVAPTPPASIAAAVVAAAPSSAAPSTVPSVAKAPSVAAAPASSSVPASSATSHALAPSAAAPSKAANSQVVAAPPAVAPVAAPPATLSASTAATPAEALQAAALTTAPLAAASPAAASPAAASPAAASPAAASPAAASPAAAPPAAASPAAAPPAAASPAAAPPAAALPAAAPPAAASPAAAPPAAAPPAARPPAAVATAPAPSAATPPLALTSPAREPTPPSPPDDSGPRLAYRPDFTQQHIQQVSSQRSTTPMKAYQGIKATMGTDSFMMAHNAKTNSYRAGAIQTAKHDRPQVPVNSYAMEHVKKAKEVIGPGTKPRATGDVPHMHSDTFMHSFVTQSRSLSPPGSSVRNQFNLAPGSKPHVSMDSYALRITKAARPKSPAPIRHSDAPDSFMVAHLKSIARFSPHKQRPHEVRL